MRDIRQVRASFGLALSLLSTFPAMPGAPEAGGVAEGVHASTVTGEMIMMGYQRWFGCSREGSGRVITQEIKTRVGA